MEIQGTLEKLRTDLEALPHDHTSPNPACEVCEDLGWIRLPTGVARCECQKRKAVAEKLRKIPERFKDSTFANYVPENGRQVEALAKISSDFTRSFFIFGDYAHGKTHLATAQYRTLVAIERGCEFLTMAELIGELRRSEMDAEYFCTVRQRVRSAEKFHLFIDDIDKFKVTDFKFEVLFDLFDTIYKRKLGLTVTSNYGLRELSTSGAVHPSIVRRIDDICEVVEV